MLASPPPPLEAAPAAVRHGAATSACAAPALLEYAACAGAACGPGRQGRLGLALAPPPAARPWRPPPAPPAGEGFGAAAFAPPVFAFAPPADFAAAPAPAFAFVPAPDLAFAPPFGFAAAFGFGFGFVAPGPLAFAV